MLIREGNLFRRCAYPCCCRCTQLLSRLHQISATISRYQDTPQSNLRRVHGSILRAASKLNVMFADICPRASRNNGGGTAFRSLPHVAFMRCRLFKHSTGLHIVTASFDHFLAGQMFSIASVRKLNALSKVDNDPLARQSLDIRDRQDRRD